MTSPKPKKKMSSFQVWLLVRSLRSLLLSSRSDDRWSSTLYERMRDMVSLGEPALEHLQAIESTLAQRGKRHLEHYVRFQRARILMWVGQPEAGVELFDDVLNREPPGEPLTSWLTGMAQAAAIAGQLGPAHRYLNSLMGASGVTLRDANACVDALAAATDAYLRGLDSSTRSKACREELSMWHRLTPPACMKELRTAIDAVVSKLRLEHGDLETAAGSLMEWSLANASSNDLEGRWRAVLERRADVTAQDFLRAFRLFARVADKASGFSPAFRSAWLMGASRAFLDQQRYVPAAVAFFHARALCKKHRIAVPSLPDSLVRLFPDRSLLTEVTEARVLAGVPDEVIAASVADDDVDPQIVQACDSIVLDAMATHRDWRRAYEQFDEDQVGLMKPGPTPGWVLQHAQALRANWAALRLRERLTNHHQVWFYQLRRGPSRAAIPQDLMHSLAEACFRSWEGRKTAEITELLDDVADEFGERFIAEERISACLWLASLADTLQCVRVAETLVHTALKTCELYSQEIRRLELLGNFCRCMRREGPQERFASLYQTVAADGRAQALRLRANGAGLSDEARGFLRALDLDFKTD